MNLSTGAIISGIGVHISNHRKNVLLLPFLLGLQELPLVLVNVRLDRVPDPGANLGRRECVNLNAAVAVLFKIGLPLRLLVLLLYREAYQFIGREIASGDRESAPVNVGFAEFI
jgi:hypothetical protein